MTNMSKTSYDIIFAGGGTTSCVIAGRLAAADPSLKLLVLEAGLHTKDIDNHVQPAKFLSHQLPSNKTLTFNVAKPSDHVSGRAVVVSCGHCVGGGSSVNFMMYTRASASDYDDWETVYQNTGWGSKNLIPLLAKTESYQVKPNEPTHGYSGPLKVSYGGVYTNIGKHFLETTAKYDHEREQVDDANALHSCNGYTRWPKWIDGETGRRSDVPHHFIYNQSHNKNLEVLDGCKVTRVIFENDRAVGVEYVNDVAINADADQTVRSVRASKLVVVSAGAFGSPAILERSGIGAKNVLQKNGVRQIIDLPGVGENYQDHNLCSVPFLASKEAETLDRIFRGDQAEISRLVDQWSKEGTGYIAHNAIDAGIKYRPNSQELKEMGPEFQSRWSEYYANAPDKPVFWMGPFSGFLGDCSALPLRKYFMMAYYSEYPISKGYLHITSGQDPHAAPDFDPGYLRDPADVIVLRLAFKKVREIARRMPIFEGGSLEGHPTFAEGSSAAYKDTSPVDISAPDIVYSAEDDKAIDAFNRNTVQTTWHSLGTCAMKPRDQGGVVDAHLNVYGVKGLKVADMSIAPSNVGANTYSTALVIGEKAAVIIAQELGIDI